MLGLARTRRQERSFSKNKNIIPILLNWLNPPSLYIQTIRIGKKSTPKQSSRETLRPDGFPAETWAHIATLQHPDRTSTHSYTDYMRRVRTTSLVHIVARATHKPNSPSEYPCMAMRHVAIVTLQSIPRTCWLGHPGF